MLLNFYKSSNCSLRKQEKTTEENKNAKYESPLILPFRDEDGLQVGFPFPFLPWPTYMMMEATDMYWALTWALTWAWAPHGTLQVAPDLILTTALWSFESDSLLEVSAKSEPSPGDLGTSSWGTLCAHPGPSFHSPTPQDPVQTPTTSSRKPIRCCHPHLPRAREGPSPHPIYHSL